MDSDRRNALIQGITQAIPEDMRNYILQDLTNSYMPYTNEELENISQTLGNMTTSGILNMGNSLLVPQTGSNIVWQFYRPELLIAQDGRLYGENFGFGIDPDPTVSMGRGTYGKVVFGTSTEGKQYAAKYFSGHPLPDLEWIGSQYIYRNKPHTPSKILLNMIKTFEFMQMFQEWGLVANYYSQPSALYLGAMFPPLLSQGEFLAASSDVNTPCAVIVMDRVLPVSDWLETACKVRFNEDCAITAFVSVFRRIMDMQWAVLEKGYYYADFKLDNLGIASPDATAPMVSPEKLVFIDIDPRAIVQLKAPNDKTVKGICMVSTVILTMVTFKLQFDITPDMRYMEEIMTTDRYDLGEQRDDDGEMRYISLQYYVANILQGNVGGFDAIFQTLGTPEEIRRMFWDTFSYSSGVSAKIEQLWEGLFNQQQYGTIFRLMLEEIYDGQSLMVFDTREAEEGVHQIVIAAPVQNAGGESPQPFSISDRTDSNSMRGTAVIEAKRPADGDPGLAPQAPPQPQSQAPSQAPPQPPRESPVQDKTADEFDQLLATELVPLTQGTNVVLNTDAGMMQLPTGYEWLLPDLTSADSRASVWSNAATPVLLDNPKYSGFLNSVIANGSFNSVIKGRKPGEADVSVVARIQGRVARPRYDQTTQTYTPRNGTPLTKPTYAQVKEFVEVACRSVELNTIMHGFDYAPKLFATTISLRKESPSKYEYNYPSMIQIMEAIDLDFLKFVWDDAFPMKAKQKCLTQIMDKYFDLVMNRNIALIDIKAENMAVKITKDADGKTVYKPLFIDLDSAYSAYLQPSDTYQARFAFVFMGLLQIIYTLPLQTRTGQTNEWKDTITRWFSRRPKEFPAWDAFYNYAPSTKPLLPKDVWQMMMPKMRAETLFPWQLSASGKRAMDQVLRQMNHYVVSNHTNPRLTTASFPPLDERAYRSQITNIQRFLKDMKAAVPRFGTITPDGAHIMGERALSVLDGYSVPLIGVESMDVDEDPDLEGYEWLEQQPEPEQPFQYDPNWTVPPEWDGEPVEIPENTIYGPDDLDEWGMPMRKPDSTGGSDAGDSAGGSNAGDSAAGGSDAGGSDPYEGLDDFHDLETGEVIRQPEEGPDAAEIPVFSPLPQPPEESEPEGRATPEPWHQAPPVPHRPQLTGREPIEEAAEAPEQLPKSYKPARHGALTILPPLMSLPRPQPGDFNVPANFMAVLRQKVGVEKKDMLEMLRDDPKMAYALTRQSYGSMKQTEGFADTINGGIVQICQALPAVLTRPAMRQLTVNAIENAAIVLPIGFTWKVPGRGEIAGPVSLTQQEVWSDPDTRRGIFEGAVAGQDEQKVIATIERGVPFENASLFYNMADIDEHVANVKWRALLSHAHLYPEIYHNALYPWTPQATLVQVIARPSTSLRDYLGREGVTTQQKIEAVVLVMDAYKKMTRTLRCVLGELDPETIGLRLSDGGEPQEVVFMNINRWGTQTIYVNPGSKQTDADAAAFFLAGLFQLIVLMTEYPGVEDLRPTTQTKAWQATLRTAIGAWVAKNIQWMGVYWERIRNWYADTSSAGTANNYGSTRSKMTAFEEYLFDIILPPRIGAEGMWKEWKAPNRRNDTKDLRKTENIQAAIMVRRAFYQLFWEDLIRDVFDAPSRKWREGASWKKLDATDGELSDYGYTHFTTDGKRRWRLLQEFLSKYVQQIAAAAPTMPIGAVARKRRAPSRKPSQAPAAPVTDVKDLPAIIDKPKTAKKLAQFHDSLRAIIVNSGVPNVKLDTGVGSVLLPAGWEWEVPGRGWTPGPFALDDQAYFRYGSNGRMNTESGSGASSIIIFGRRPGEAERSVIARLQGRDQLPKKVPSKNSVPDLDDVSEQIQQFISDTTWHMRVHSAGFAGPIYSTIVMPYKTMPFKYQHNYPCMLQVSAAQDMDLASYFSGLFLDTQKINAFIMFMDRYAKLLHEANIAQVDMKMGNVTVNVDARGNVTEVMFIDLDDAWTWYIPADDTQLQVIYWIAAVIQTLSLAPKTISGNMAGAIRNWLKEPAQAWMQCDWDAIRNLDPYNLPNDPTLRKLWQMLNPDTADQYGPQSYLSYMFVHYTIRRWLNDVSKWDPDPNSSAFRLMMQDLRTIASRGASPEIVTQQSAHVMLGGRLCDIEKQTLQTTRKASVMQGLASLIGSLRM